MSSLRSTRNGIVPTAATAIAFAQLLTVKVSILTMGLQAMTFVALAAILLTAWTWHSAR